jgi:hypothetical protein
MLLTYSPAQLDPRLDEDGKPVKDSEGKEAVGPFLSDLFEGTVQIKAPSYPERLRFPKELGLESFSDAKEEDRKEKLMEAFNQMEMLAKAAVKVQPYIQEVKLKYLKGDIVLNSSDDLYDFPAAGPLVTGLCSKFILGFLEKKT